MADLELVIKIPDRIYKIAQSKKLNIIDSEIVEKAIKNGAPIPEKHGRLIDGDKVLDDIEKQYPASVSESDKRKRYARLVYYWTVKNAPTIIEGSERE